MSLALRVVGSPRHALPEGNDRLELEREAAELGLIVDGDDGMLQAFHDLKVYARGNRTVLLRGETGTGKEPSAMALHDLTGKRDGARDRPFYALNCASISEGLFESEFFGHVKGAFTNANVDRKGAFAQIEKGGTLFLDEIGDLPPDQQAKLLRVLETKSFRPVGSSAKEQTFAGRIVCATSRNLEELVRAKKFRLDLYERITAAQIALPKLEDRSPEHAEALIDHFIRHIPDARPHVSITPEARGNLAKLQFPGNVRGLKNYLERAYLFAEAEQDGPVTIGIEHVRAAESPISFFGAETSDKVREVLTLAQGNVILEIPTAGDVGNVKLTVRLGTKESGPIAPAKLEEIVSLVRGAIVKEVMDRSGSAVSASDLLDVSRGAARTYLLVYEGIARDARDTAAK